RTRGAGAAAAATGLAIAADSGSDVPVGADLDAGTDGGLLLDASTPAVTTRVSAGAVGTDELVSTDGSDGTQLVSSLAGESGSAGDPTRRRRRRRSNHSRVAGSLLGESADTVDDTTPRAESA
ncbi:ATP-dependent helicase, partial [Frankia sp. R82]|nr:ATP-dependent helicase [Frankia sp. R82]